MKKVILFSGPIHSGKTTRLQKFISDKNCDGIIAPVKDGKRYIQRIKTNEIRLLDTESEDSIQIGKHKFSKEILDWAKVQIQESLKNKIDYLVIDEIGKLELRDEGYEPIVSEAINHFKAQSDFNLVVVVRDSLANEVFKKYGLNNFEIENPQALSEPEG